LGEMAVFKVTVPLGATGSFYSRNGDVFAMICFVIFLLLGPIPCIRRRY